MSFKTSETLLGIETLQSGIKPLIASCFKTSETLLGIETTLLPVKVHGMEASKPLKPF